MKRKKSIQEILYVVILLAAMIALFGWYTRQNSVRMEERNKNYAADSARLKAGQLDEELSDALNRINVHSYFVGEGLSEPVITVKMLREMERNSLFDALIYTDAEGVDHAADGRTADVRNRDFYNNGMKGEGGISVVFDSHFFDETMVNFYAPVWYKGEIIGVLRGAYLAEEYLQDMLATSYFGEKAEVYLCTPEGRVVAGSDDREYNEKLLDPEFLTCTQAAWTTKMTQPDSAFTTFDYVWIMTQGGPAGSTEVFATRIYKTTFINYDAGYGAAMSLSVCLLALTVYFILRIIQRKGAREE